MPWDPWLPRCSMSLTRSCQDSQDASKRVNLGGHTIFIKFCTVILHPKGAPVCVMASRSYDWDLRNISKTTPKMVKKAILDFFRYSQKLSILLEKIFYSHSTPYWSPMCAMASKSYGWDVRYGVE